MYIQEFFRQKRTKKARLKEFMDNSTLSSLKNEPCFACPRQCGAFRPSRAGFCGVSENPVVAKVMTHFWEEPCISGDKGSGAIFFSGCNLRCVFCQNKKISRDGFGREITVDGLSKIFERLDKGGVNNINLVTPTHFSSAISAALSIYRPSIPVVYNCGGYESVDTLKALEGKIQIYLPDFKYSDSSLSSAFSAASDYPKTALAALWEMYRQVGPCKFGEDGILKSGMMVRHLVLPGHLENSYGVIDLFADTFEKGTVLFSLMSQYTPQRNNLLPFKELNRRLTTLEYNRVCDYMIKKGVDYGFCQERSSAKEEYTPDFDLSGF